MESNLRKSKYKILVLVNQNRPSSMAIENAVDLAKKVDGSIDIFYVKPLKEIPRCENQLAVLRTLSEERVKSKDIMRNLVDSIMAEENIPISYNFAIGNVVNEVQEHITKTQPDVVVLGKRKTKVLSFLGDGLTTHLLKNHEGGILISGTEGRHLSNSHISIGSLGDNLAKDTSGLVKDLKRYSDKPLKLFKVNQPAEQPNTNSVLSQESEHELFEKATTFEFDGGVDVSNSVSKYIEKSKVGLLFVEKSKLLNLGNILSTIDSQIQKTINKTNIPVLILNN